MSFEFLNNERRKLQDALNPNAKILREVASETPTFDELQRYIRNNLHLESKILRYLPETRGMFEMLHDSQGPYYSLDATSEKHIGYSRTILARIDSSGNIISRAEKRVITHTNPSCFFTSHLDFNGAMSFSIFNRSPNFGIIFEDGLATYWGYDNEPLRDDQITEKMKSMFEMAKNSKYLTEQAGFEDSVF